MGRSSPEAIRLRKLLDELDQLVDDLSHPNWFPPNTLPRLVEEMDRTLDEFDRSNLDETMQGRLLKKTDWYRKKVALSRRRRIV